MLNSKNMANFTALYASYLRFTFGTNLIRSFILCLKLITLLKSCAVADDCKAETQVIYSVLSKKKHLFKCFAAQEPSWTYAINGLCGSVWHSIPTIYLKTSELWITWWCHTTSKINPGAETREKFFCLEIGCKIGDLALGEFNRESWQERFPWLRLKQPEQTNSSLSWHACLLLPDKCINRVTPPTLLLCWGVPLKCLWKGPFWSLAKSCLAAQHPGMITLSDEKT